VLKKKKGIKTYSSCCFL